MFQATGSSTHKSFFAVFFSTPVRSLFFLAIFGFFLSTSMAQEVKAPSSSVPQRAPAKSKASKKRISKRKAPAKKRKASVSNELIREIRVEGTKRLEKDVITNRIHSAVGQKLDSEKVREDIQTLFSLGYFSDIQVDAQDSSDGVILIYKVKEKPVLSDLTFEGNSELKTEELQDALGLKAFEIFNESKMKDGLEKIQQKISGK